MDIYCKYCKRFLRSEFRGSDCCTKKMADTITGYRYKIYCYEINTLKRRGNPWPCKPSLNLRGRFRKLLGLPIGP